MTLSEQTTAAFAAWENAKKDRKDIAAAIKDMKASNSTLVDLEEKKKEAAAEYKSELFQWEGQHESILTKLKDAKVEEDEAHATFTDLYVAADKAGAQLELFSLDGSKVNIALTSKATKEKPEKPKVEAEPADSDLL